MARVLLDLAHTIQRAGDDLREVFARTRDLLLECDARLWLPEAKAELAGLS
jgi:hypothetical protein